MGQPVPLDRAPPPVPSRRRREGEQRNAKAEHAPGNAHQGEEERFDRQREGAQAVSDTGACERGKTPEKGMEGRASTKRRDRHRGEEKEQIVKDGSRHSRRSTQPPVS